MNFKRPFVFALAITLFVVSAVASAQDDITPAASPMHNKQARKQARKNAREKNRNEVKALEKNGFDPRDATGYPENIQRAQSSTRGAPVSGQAPTN